MTRPLFPSSWLPVLSLQFHFKYIPLSTQMPWGISYSLTALCGDTRIPTKTRSSLETLESTASLNLSSFLGWPSLLLSEQGCLLLYSDLQGHHSKSSSDYPVIEADLMQCIHMRLRAWWLLCLWIFLSFGQKHSVLFPVLVKTLTAWFGLISVLREVSIYSH